MINLDSKICILGGGWSNEREISLKSSNDVFQSLKTIIIMLSSMTW